MDSEQEPASVWKAMVGLALICAGVVLMWEMIATSEMKDIASRMGDSWVETGKRVDRLQSTPWLENLGVLPKGTMKTREEKLKEQADGR